jgi:ubiquinone/menaquinone biosynthesis C-methylase UbiE
MENVKNCNDLIDHRTIKTIMQNDRWSLSNAKAYNRYRMISRKQNWKRLLTTELSGVASGETVLEVGAGTGFITTILADTGYNVLATDLSPSMLSLAAENIKMSGIADRVQFVTCDAESLNVQDNTFPAVVSRWVIWTLPRPKKALAEMVRTLAPGGRLILIDGKHQVMGRFAQLRATLVDILLARRLPGWRPSDYSTITNSLPCLDAPEVAATLKGLGLQQVRSRRLSDKEGDGFFHNWLMGNAWKSYIVTGTKRK